MSWKIVSHRKRSLWVDLCVKHKSSYDCMQKFISIKVYMDYQVGSYCSKNHFKTLIHPSCVFKASSVDV